MLSPFVFPLESIQHPDVHTPLTNKQRGCGERGLQKERGQASIYAPRPRHSFETVRPGGIPVLNLTTEAPGVLFPSRPNEIDLVQKCELENRITMSWD